MGRKSVLAAVLLLLYALFHSGLVRADPKDQNKFDEALRQLRSSDEVIGKGTVIFKRISGGKFYRFTLRYAPDQRFTLKQEAFGNLQLQGKQTQPSVVQVFDGRDTYLFMGASGLGQKSYVTIDAGRPEEAGQAYRFSGGLYPGASPLLGRGLSFLSSPSFTVAPNHDLLIKGKTPDGSTITATLDSKHDLLAKRIDRFSNNKLIQTITLGVPTASNKTWIASSASCSYNGSGQLIISDTYSLINAEFSDVSPAIFQTNIIKGTMALDKRAGQQVSWDMHVNLSGQKLLKLTQKKLDEITRLKSQDGSAQRLQSIGTIGLCCSPLLLLLLVKLRRRKHKNQAV